MKFLSAERIREFTVSTVPMTRHGVIGTVREWDYWCFPRHLAHIATLFLRVLPA